MVCPSRIRAARNSGFLIFAVAFSSLARASLSALPFSSNMGAAWCLACKLLWLCKSCLILSRLTAAKPQKLLTRLQISWLIIWICGPLPLATDKVRVASIRLFAGKEISDGKHHWCASPAISGHPAIIFVRTWPRFRIAGAISPSVRPDNFRRRRPLR